MTLLVSFGRGPDTLNESVKNEARKLLWFHNLFLHDVVIPSFKCA